jgi:hypothetical protein
MGLTELFDPVVELGFGQQLIQFPEERMSGRLGQVGGNHPQSLLLPFAFTQGHHDSCCVRGLNSNPDGRYYTTDVKGFWTFSTG